MDIREATDEDIPEILEVLKASLGETSSKKSEEVWRYKHIDNPFGRSLVLVAIEGSKIIGVRAFMRWKWQKTDEVLSVFRAVDTATHPKHQGKGVFKKLTLKALEIAKQNGDHFVFNTPNEQSKPGYIKMGWEEVAKIKVRIKPINPIYWRYSNVTDQFAKDIEFTEISFQHLTEERNAQMKSSGKFFTPKTPEYFKWRYENNTLQDYIIKATDDIYIAGYVKTHSKFRELRIVEAITLSALSVKSIKITIDKLAKDFGVQFVSFAPSENLKFFNSFSGKFGPVLTVKEINLIDNQKKGLLNLNNWIYSLGDLELF
ncbi:GNAT family N-acetyltransferase [Christiangramia portivictoriae]|uniref:GNAT family N-acetyltransferase n=1 Tax=Christiangramia portivictoriae TaxID=326069 RepID=UPI0004254751|nr:GNAT family N-acetyltransferase [Christiangramia portivictoriae]